MRVVIKGVPASDPLQSSGQSGKQSPGHSPDSSPELPALIDNPFAPELFASGLAGFANLNGVIVLTLESARCDHARQPPSVERIVVGRVALTSGAAQDLVAGLNQFLDQQGLSPSKAMAGGATFQ